MRCRPVGLLAFSACLAVASPAHGQLRPYGPFAWETFDPSHSIVLSVGSAVLWDQRAPLAGTQGRLVEIGVFQAFARSGRIVLEAGGTTYRIFREESVYAEPTGGAEERPLGTRSDVGDFLLSTTILLAGREAPAGAILRFGSRLPTTDNRVGIERDAIDFFALVGGRLDRGVIRATAEVGLGIHGTRLPNFEQSDAFVYILGLTARSGVIRPSVHVLGHADALDFTIRGNERLSEVRGRVRTGGDSWIQAEVVKGLTAAAPNYGFTLAIGMLR